MTASEVDHEIVLNQGAWPKPTAKAHHGTHHRKNTLRPRHSRSRSESPELDISLLILSGLTFALTCDGAFLLRARCRQLQRVVRQRALSLGGPP